jgi:hypothetical protein
MPTLEEVYDRRLDDGDNDGGFRVRAGLALLTVGVFLTLLGGVAAFSETVAAIFDAAEYDWQMWGVGAKFAGIGVPLSFTGVFVVVPAPRRDQAIAASGILVAFFGVALFDYAYPTMWSGDPLDLSPLVFFVYTLGSFLMFGALFRSILDIEISLPQSSLSFNYVEDDRLPSREERVSEMSSSSGGKSTDGGVGFAVSTNANDAEVMGNDAGRDSQRDEETTETSSSAGFAGDRYCGNCAFYEYAQDENSNEPFCEFHGRKLQDLEACDEHEMRLGPPSRE